MSETLRTRFTETIEALVGRKVITFISGVDLDTETNAEVFVLEPQDIETGDEAGALDAWAAQTRRQARLLHGEQGTLREGRARSQQDASGPAA